MTVTTKAPDAAAESSAKYDKFSTSSSVTEDDNIDVEIGIAKGSSYDQSLQIIETSEKSKHGVSEHSDTGLLPPQMKRSSEDSCATNTHTRDDYMKMASTESNSNNNDIRASRKSQISSSRRASTTEERQNPFAYREGNALIWRNVNMTLKAKNGKQSERKLLNSVWGEVPPGEITAIMGPSGAGEFYV